MSETWIQKSQSKATRCQKYQTQDPIRGCEMDELSGTARDISNVSVVSGSSRISLVPRWYIYLHWSILGSSMWDNVIQRWAKQVGLCTEFERFGHINVVTGTSNFRTSSPDTMSADALSGLWGLTWRVGWRGGTVRGPVRKGHICKESRKETGRSGTAFRTLYLHMCCNVLSCTTWGS